MSAQTTLDLPRSELVEFEAGSYVRFPEGTKLPPGAYHHERFMVVRLGGEREKLGHTLVVHMVTGRAFYQGNDTPASRAA